VFVLWDLVSCHAVPGEGARKLGLAGDWTVKGGTEVPPRLMKASGALANQAAAFGFRSVRAEPWTRIMDGVSADPLGRPSRRSQTARGRYWSGLLSPCRSTK
jgi:hypothetical protein